MDNRETAAARTYHRGTNHPDGKLMDPAHYYHPELEPLKFKIYQGTQMIALPLETTTVGMPALDAIAADSTAFSAEAVPTLETLSQVLYFSAGVTKQMTYPWGSIYFRAAACTGALYHIEIYVVCGELPGLAAGVYHYEPQAHGLATLREGDYRRELVEASGEAPGMVNAPLILVFTDVFWRNAIKYQARAYRHTYWDGGTILANTLAVCAAKGLPTGMVLGFVDDCVNKLLGIDAQKEASFALLPVGNAPHTPALATPEIGAVDFATVPIGGRQPIQFAAIHTMHDASSLRTAQEANTWRINTPSLDFPTPRASSGSDRTFGARPLIPIRPEHEAQDQARDLGEVILRRGSTRQFTREPLSFAQLSTLLAASLHGVPADFLNPYGSTLNTVYLIVNAVDGLEVGTYMYHRGEQALERLKAGDFRDTAGELALGQDLAADASVNLYFLADLEPILSAYGNRGYRAAQLEAAVEAGRMYLAAYAQRFGATGLTFYDDAVTEFLSPHAAGKSVMFLMALGRKAPRR